MTRPDPLHRTPSGGSMTRPDPLHRTPSGGNMTRLDPLHRTPSGGSMTRLDARLMAFLRGELQGLAAPKTLAHLFDRGLLDRRACEAEAIRAEIARLVEQGIPRCEAMELAAERFCCSYGKVKGIVYGRR